MKTILVLISLFVCGLSLAAPKEENPAWFTCQQDADCVNISFSCAGGTVNKRFAKEAHEFYMHQNAARDCVQLPPDKVKVVPFKVFCKDNKCASQGRNPKVGFS